jgi:hypothetical protein
VGNRRLVYIAIDWTYLSHSYQILSAALISDGRALPLYYRTYLWGCPPGEKDGWQVKMEIEFLKELKLMLPPGVEAVIMADRGFGRASYIHALEEIGFHYILRTQKMVYIESALFCGMLKNMKIYRGQSKDCGFSLYGKEARLKTRLIVFYGRKSSEPWYLLTDMTDEKRRFVKQYAKRMQIEETFKDLKQIKDGFQLHKVALKSPERYDRLLLVAAYAYALLTLAGIYGERVGYARRLQSNSTRTRTLALWRVGMSVIRSLCISMENILNQIPVLYDF